MPDLEGVYVHAFMLCTEPPTAFPGGHVVKRADKFRYSGLDPDPQDLPLSLYVLIVIATEEPTALTLGLRHTEPGGAQQWLSDGERHEWPIEVRHASHNMVIPWTTKVRPGRHALDLVVDGMVATRTFFTIDYSQDKPIVH